MEIIFVGTGSGRTSLERFHSSICFKDEKKSILIDVGDGISKALLSQNIEYNSITEIIISHYHSDHFSGLPSLLTQMIIEDRKTPFKIYTHEKLINPLQNFLYTTSIFLENLKFGVEIIGFNFVKEVFLNDTIKFSAKQNSHITNKHNIELEKAHFISSSFLFHLGNKKLVYTSDIGNYDDLFLFQDTKADIFIAESTHIPLSRIEDAITILDPHKVILTHIDDKKEINNWFNKMSDGKKDKILIARDGMQIILE